MPKQTLGLDGFLRAYRDVVGAIRDLARAAVIAPATVRDALRRRPFALPAVLRDAPHADAVASDLRRLKKQLDELKPSTPATDDRIASVIDEVLDPRAAASGPMRGGDVQFEASTRKPPGLPRQIDSGSAQSMRPPGQRAKPPDRGPPPPAPSPTAAPVAAEPPASPRWISAEIDDHERNDPLELDETYTIAFGVDVDRRANAVGEAVVEEGIIFPEGVKDVELTVDLHSDDFDIDALKQTFKLERTGKSRGKARFEITPKHEGRSTLTATIHKERNFVQQMTITLSVGAANAEPPSTTSVSRPRSAVPQIQGREVMIVLTPAVPSGYDFMARDERGIKTAHLEVEPNELGDAITAARDSLLGVVQHADANGEDVFQTRIDIETPDNYAALRIMAQTGARLFQLLFKHPGGSQDATAIGTWLRGLMADGTEPLSIQVMSKRAPIPWSLMYTGDVSAKATLDWKNFLGVRHIIEQLPIVDQLGQGGASIASDQPGLEVSINLNRKIDDEMRADWVEKQEKFWNDARAAYSRLHVTPRTQRAELLSALADETTGDQILYFYGHAETTALGARGGSDASALSLSDAKITLGELNTQASTDIKLRGNPLVFINACESAELSPLFYDGFVPYFMGKGARGVIGTECRTPGIFAAEWARRFFERFLAGEPLGALFLALRREFLEQHHNPLGLLYAVHCDGDTQVYPAL